MNDQKSVLVVEDDFLIAMDLEDSLKDNGFDVVGPVGNSDDAMALIETEQIHAAILDFNLSNGTSEEVALKLVEQKIPVMFLSGQSLLERPQALSNCAVLSKSISFEVVHQALVDALQ